MTVLVALLDDALHEAAEESMSVLLRNPAGAILADEMAIGVILDDDLPPAVSVSDAAGEEATGELAFAVALDGPSARRVSVDYATSDGTATAGADYLRTSGTLVFAPGEVSMTIRVAILDDSTNEADEETFALAFGDVVGAVVADGEATGTILWGVVGGGRGETSAQRCGSDRIDAADLSVRLAAIGGRHPFTHRDRLAVSVVEDAGVLRLTTGTSTGLAGDREVTVGQARLGLEAAGVAPPECDCWLSTYVRVLARGDWGDGAAGVGLELAAGVRYRNVPWRLEFDAGVRSLAAHSAENVADHNAFVAVSILPKADGTGVEAALSLRREGSMLQASGGVSRWGAGRGWPTGAHGLPAHGPGEADRRWSADTRLAYGISAAHGVVKPFLELDVLAPGAGWFGVRYEPAGGPRGVRPRGEGRTAGGSGGCERTLRTDRKREVLARM